MLLHYLIFYTIEGCPYISEASAEVERLEVSSDSDWHLVVRVVNLHLFSFLFVFSQLSAYWRSQRPDSQPPYLTTRNLFQTKSLILLPSNWVVSFQHSSTVPYSVVSSKNMQSGSKWQWVDYHNLPIVTRLCCDLIVYIINLSGLHAILSY